MNKETFALPAICACGHVWTSGSVFSIRNLAGAVTDTLYTDMQHQKAKVTGAYSHLMPRCQCCRRYACHRCRARCTDDACRKLSCRTCWTKTQQRCHRCVERRRLLDLSMHQLSTLSVTQLAASLRRLHHTATASLQHVHLVAELLRVCGLTEQARRYQMHVRLVVRSASVNASSTASTPEAEIANPEQEMEYIVASGERSPLPLEASATTAPPTVDRPERTAPEELATAAEYGWSDTEEGEESDAHLAANDGDEPDTSAALGQLDAVRDRYNAIRQVLFSVPDDSEGPAELVGSPGRTEVGQELRDALDDLAKIKEHLDNTVQKELCVVCQDGRIDCVFLYCGHQVACRQCAKQMCTCPICRRHIESVLRTYRP